MYVSSGLSSDNSSSESAVRYTLVRGTTDIVSPHGIPVDLLDRCVLLLKNSPLSR